MFHIEDYFTCHGNLGANNVLGQGNGLGGYFLGILLPCPPAHTTPLLTENKSLELLMEEG